MMKCQLALLVLCCASLQCYGWSSNDIGRSKASLSTLQSSTPALSRIIRQHRRQQQHDFKLLMSSSSDSNKSERTAATAATARSTRRRRFFTTALSSSATTASGSEDSKNAAGDDASSKKLGNQNGKQDGLAAAGLANEPKASADVLKEVEEWRQRAQKLRSEAETMKLQLQSQQKDFTKSKEADVDSMIQRVLPVNTTAINVAGKLRKERWSSDQVISVINRLHEREMIARGQGSLMDLTPDFQIGNVRNSAEVNITECHRLRECAQVLLEAAALLDAEVADNSTNLNPRWGAARMVLTIQSRLKELESTEKANLKRREAAILNQIVAKTNETSDKLDRSLQRTFPGFGAFMKEVESSSAKYEIRASYHKVESDLSKYIDKDNNLNFTAMIVDGAFVPRWVPTTFLPYLLTSQRSNLGKAEAHIIKEKVLMGSRFYLTSFHCMPGAAIFRGNLRSGDKVDYEAAFEDIQTRLKLHGLADKVQLFLVPDPEWGESFADDPEPRPVILAFSKDLTPDDSQVKTNRIEKAVQQLSYPLSLATTFAYSVSCYALNPAFFESLMNQNDVTVLISCIPVFLGVLGIQLVHEVAHYFVAKRRKIKIGLPIPIPSPQLGLFGCITPLRSFPKNRAALMDLAISGPAASAVVSTLCLVLGIFGSVHATAENIVRFPVIPAVLLKSSLFIGSIVSWLAPKAMMVPPAQPIPIHPLFVVGFAGLLSSALNLLPMFRLDGGRAASAVFGTKQSVMVSAAIMFLILSTILTEGSGLLVTWMAAVLVFQRRPEISLRDEMTEVDETRAWIWLSSLIFAGLVILPFPGASGSL